MQGKDKSTGQVKDTARTGQDKKGQEKTVT